MKQISLIDQLQYEDINRPFKLNVIWAIKFIDIIAFCPPPASFSSTCSLSACAWCSTAWEKKKSNSIDYSGRTRKIYWIWKFDLNYDATSHVERKSLYYYVHNVFIVTWNTFSTKHSTLFITDGVHIST